MADTTDAPTPPIPRFRAAETTDAGTETEVAPPPAVPDENSTGDASDGDAGTVTRRWAYADPRVDDEPPKGSRDQRLLYRVRRRILNLESALAEARREERHQQRKAEHERGRERVRRWRDPVDKGEAAGLSPESLAGLLEQLRCADDPDEAARQLAALARQSGVV